MCDAAARTGIESKGQIKPALLGLDVGDIALPELAREIPAPAPLPASFPRSCDYGGRQWCEAGNGASAGRAGRSPA
jgi:hypothetical protein